MSKPALDMQEKYKAQHNWQDQSRLAWLRYKAQCRFRNEPWISWKDWQDLWFDEDIFSRKGRGNRDLVISKICYDQPYSRTNCCLVQRHHTLRARRYFHFFNGQACLDHAVIERKLS